MPTAYQSFVSEHLKKAPAHMSQTEKMKWCGGIWQGRKTAKGIQAPKLKPADPGPLIDHMIANDDPNFKLPKRAPKPKKSKATDIRPLANKKAKGLVSPGAKGKKTGGKARTKADIFKDTSRVATIASKAGLLDKIVKKISPADLAASKVLNGGVHMNRGRKGANLVSIKTHT